MPYQAKIVLVNLTPKERTPCKIPHICCSSFKSKTLLKLDFEANVTTQILFSANLDSFLIQGKLLYGVSMHIRNKSQSALDMKHWGLVPTRCIATSTFSSLISREANLTRAWENRGLTVFVEKILILYQNFNLSLLIIETYFNRLILCPGHLPLSSKFHKSRAQTQHSWNMTPLLEYHIKTILIVTRN